MRFSIPALLLLLVTVAAAAAQLPPGVVRDPSAALVVYDDVDRFTRVFAALPATADTLALLDSAYLARATTGLRVYAGMYGVDADALWHAIRRSPERYARTATLAPDVVRQIEPRVRAAYARLRALYPDALFPPVFHLVGPHRAGGAVQREGIFIAVETYATPTDSDSVARAALERLVHLVVHELVHFNQAAWNPELYQRPPTLLGRAIREGVADFVAELISGGHTNVRAHAYGVLHERELWRRFRAEMSGTQTGDWFFARPRDRAWPQDLGYFIGYRIALSRFLREPDVSALLRVPDYEAFLASSGYAP